MREEILAKLDDLAALKEGWCYPGALPISSAALDVGRSTADWEYRPSFIAPLDDGGIQIEWRNGSKEIEAEIGPDGKPDGALLVTVMHPEIEVFPRELECEEIECRDLVGLQEIVKGLAA